MGKPTVSVYFSRDGVPIVQIDTQEDMGRIQVYLNDECLWDADPGRWD